MARPIRRDTIFPDGIYHVYARGNDRMTLFRDPEDYKVYLDALAELKTPQGVLLYHYDLMPNHIHFVLSVTDPKALSSFMQKLQSRFAKHFGRKYSFVGHVWQGRFKNRLIKNDADLLACGNYIEMNPVRAGLVTDPADWPYSSYRTYGCGRIDMLVDIDPLYTELGRTAIERQVVYRRLVTQTRAMSVPLGSDPLGDVTKPFLARQ